MHLLSSWFEGILPKECFSAVWILSKKEEKPTSPMLVSGTLIDSRYPRLNSPLKELLLANTGYAVLPDFLNQWN